MPNMIVKVRKEEHLILKITVNIKVPNILNDKCIIPVLLAFIPLPIVLINAVVLVPILDPNIINIPFFISIAPP